MKSTTEIKASHRNRRRLRIRSKVKGTASIPRLSVFKSNKYVYVQLIDDEAGKTLAEVTSRSISKGTVMEKAKEVGLLISKKAKEQKIEKIAFDRGGFIYTGKIKAIAEGAREGGLIF